jgi:hypothetical protein
LDWSGGVTYNYVILGVPHVMSLEDFIGALMENGEVTVAPEINTDLDGDVTEALRKLDRMARLEAHGEAPPLDIAAATWAARMLYRSCQLIVNRSVDEKTAQHLLEPRCPSSRGPATDYSADLLFRFLPDLCKLAKGLAPGDPVTTLLLGLAREWPLSSVGITGVDDVKIESFIRHPCLHQLYVDRIFEHKHVARARDPRVADGIRAALGAYPKLCPSFTPEPEKGTACPQPNP